MNLLGTLTVTFTVCLTSVTPIELWRWFFVSVFVLDWKVGPIFWGAPCGSGGVPVPLGVPPVPSWGPWGPIGPMGGAPPSGALGAL